MNLVLGIDPGTATTGYGLVRRREDETLECAGYGIIQTPSDELDEVRLRLLYVKVCALIHDASPASVAVEKLFFQRNVSTAIKVGQARGVILLAVAQGRIELTEYTPNEVKQAVTGYGSAQKRQVQEMVRILLNLPELPRPDDAADALAIAICHINTVRYQV